MTTEKMHPLDPYAIAAFAARQGIPDALTAAEAYASLTPGARETWRSVADAVLMLRDLGQPAITVTPVGYQGPARHTWTAACDGFHESQACPGGVVAAAPGDPR